MGEQVTFNRDPATITCKQGQNCPFLKKGTCCFKHSENANQEESQNPQGEGTAFAWECGERPDPPLTVGECPKKGVCITWMRTGPCVNENAHTITVSNLRLM